MGQIYNLAKLSTVPAHNSFCDSNVPLSLLLLLFHCCMLGQSPPSCGVFVEGSPRGWVPRSLPPLPSLQHLPCPPSLTTVFQRHPLPSTPLLLLLLPPPLPILPSLLLTGYLALSFLPKNPVETGRGGREGGREKERERVSGD